jgi:hypothetical protein
MYKTALVLVESRIFSTILAEHILNLLLPVHMSAYKSNVAEQIFMKFDNEAKIQAISFFIRSGSFLDHFT